MFNPSNIAIISQSSSPHVELLTILCHSTPHESLLQWLTWQFTLYKAYNNKVLLDFQKVLWWGQAKHSEAAFIVAEDFIRAR